MQEAHDDVGDLDAGVVDVVLHVDFVAGGAEQAHKGVAEDGVAQMADVRGLVGIDAGVLDKGHCVGQTFGREQCLVGGDQSRGCGTIEARVDVAGAGHFESGEAFDGTERGDDFLRDDFGRLAQRARQLQSDGRGDLAECRSGGVSRGIVLDVEIVFFFQHGAKTLAEPLLQFQIHAMSLRKSLIFKVILAPAVRRARFRRSARRLTETGKSRAARCRKMESRLPIPLPRLRARTECALHDRLKLNSQSRFYLTTPIYYVNARPHLGHAYSTIVCDAIARRKRALGIDTWFLTGTDEHGQKIERSAKLAGCTPQEFADQDCRRVSRAVGPAGAHLRRLHPHHRSRGTSAACRSCLRRCAIRGYIYKGSYTGQYCVFDEAYVDGPPGTPCPDCGRMTETVSEENYFFKLSAFERKLLEFYEANPEFMGPESTRREVISFVRSGLKDLSVSRTSFSWGIPVPGDEKHVVYVWLDALANYITALGYGSDDPKDKARFEKFWPADIHLIGKEISRFHCVYWPAFLMAAGIAPPRSVRANGWLLFDQGKMSKSRGNIVRAETVQEVLGADALRYFLLREIPFGQDGNFSSTRWCSATTATWPTATATW